MLQTTAPDLYVIHQGQSGGSGMSPRIWDRMKGSALAPDGFRQGKSFADDFLCFPKISPGTGGTTTGNALGYGYYVDSATAAGTIQQLATNNDGVVAISTAAQDNHENWLTSGGNTGTLAMVSDTSGSDKTLLFEARFSVGQIVTHNLFIGMSEEGLAAADTVTDAGALASKDLLGFWILEGAATTLVFGYRKAGQSAVSVIASLATVAADTFYKVGFAYEPMAPAAKRISVYLNNVEQSTYVTATNIAAATFPDGEELALLAGIKNGAAAVSALNLDWWAFWQAR
jgi:hypothetical protein